MNHKAGFVNIIGNPNVGKSTLVNALLGESISIITPKAQTTRHRILGILNEEAYQIVFSDTPGVIIPVYLLQETMMHALKESLRDGDILICMVEKKEPLKDLKIMQVVQRTDIPLIILLNKMDKLSDKELEDSVEYWHEVLPKASILPVSALKKVNLDLLLKKIISLLPENPPFFPKDQLSDRTQRFFVNEIIREKILSLYKKEIPYCTEVITDSFKEEEKMISIHTTIYVERESQKAILIGHKGKGLCRLGKVSRKKLSRFFTKAIYLYLKIKVVKNWRSDKNILRQLGYMH